MKQTEGKIDAMKAAVKSKSPLAMAMLEDESVRLAAEETAREHLNRVYEEEDGMPYWAWAILWFVFGVLFDITVTNIGMQLWKYTGGCAG